MNMMKTKKICDHCRKDPGPDMRNKILWNGFIDKDSNQLVCWKCRARHYKKKSRTEFANMYTEMPVMLNGS